MSRNRYKGIRRSEILENRLQTPMVFRSGLYSSSSHVHSTGDITAGIFDPARLGSGTATANTFLRGDGVWSEIVVSGGATVTYSHVHSAGDITSGILDPARLGSGTATSTTYLRGDGVWASISASGDGSLSSHQALLNLQGGGAGEYYHLTSAQWVGVVAAGWASATHTHSYETLYAALSHTHSYTGIYALNVHTHVSTDITDRAWASATHTHAYETLYAAIDHTHSYTSVYATVSHTHAYLPLSGGTVSGSLVVDGPLKVLGSSGISGRLGIATIWSMFASATGKVKINVGGGASTWTAFEADYGVGGTTRLYHGDIAVLETTASGAQADKFFASADFVLAGTSIQSLFASVGHTHSYSALYASVGHIHAYLPLSGGTVSGSLVIDGNLIIRNAGNSRLDIIAGGSNNATLAFILNESAVESLRAVWFFNGNNDYLQATVYDASGTNAQAAFRSYHNAQVELFFGGAKVFETTSGGALVTGALNATTDVRIGGTSVSTLFASAGHTHSYSAIYASISHVHAASAITSGTVDTARLGSGTANSSTFLRGDQTWATPVGGSGESYIIRADTATASCGTWITWQRLNADQIASQSNSATVMFSTLGVGAGTWQFNYHIIYQTAATTTGVGMYVNHTGASPGHFVAMSRFVTTGGAAATGVADQVQSSQTAGIVEGKGERVLNTQSSQTVGVDTASANCYTVYSGLLVVTNSGALQFKVTSEVNGSNVHVKAGSFLELKKIA